MSYLRALWFLRAPLLMLASGTFAYYFSSQSAEFRTGYAFTDVGVPLYSLTVIGPLVACWAAYAAGAIGPLLARPIRTRTSMTRIAGVLALCVALAVFASTSVVLVTVGPQLSSQLVFRGLVPFAAGSFLAAAVGLCLGFGFSRVVSMPLAAALAWIWFCIPQITLWSGGRVSNVTTTFVVCCTRLEEPSDLSLSLSLATSLLTLSVLALSLIRRLRSGERRRFREWGVAIFAPIVAISPALLVPPSDQDLVAQPRQGDVACEMFEPVRVCVWPEAKAGLTSFGKAASALSSEAAEVGLATPKIWSERTADGGVTLEWNPATPESLQPSVVALALVQWWQCDPAQVDDLTTSLSQPGVGLSSNTAQVIKESCNAAGA